MHDSFTTVYNDMQSGIHNTHITLCNWVYIMVALHHHITYQCLQMMPLKQFWLRTEGILTKVNIIDYIN